MINVNIKDELKELHNQTKLDHLYQAFEWANKDGWEEKLINLLKPVIRELYLDYSNLKKQLDETGFSEKDIEKHIKNLLKVSIPVENNVSDVNNFSVQRSEFAEILASICLEELFKTTMPVSNIKYKELSDRSSRGIDILGYETDGSNLSLIICEVKASSDKNNPPGVVDSGKDCLRNQLITYISDKNKTLDRINTLRKKCMDLENKKIMTKISMLWGKQDHSQLNVVLCPVLIREKDKYDVKDFGSFRQKPSDFNPGKIRYLILCLHGSINKLSQKCYEEASKHDKFE